MLAASSSLVRHPRPIGPQPRRSGVVPLVLGFDPGLSRTGYAALQPADGRPRIREAGVLVTSSRDDLGGRLHQLHRDVTSLFEELRPDLVMLEDLFVHRAFPRTAIVLGHARGIIYLAAAAARVQVMTLAPSAVKRAVTGSGNASKAQVQAAVRTLLGLRKVSDSHAADALALAYAGLSRAGARIGSVRR
jgi:crossover junction endodeoxyribonuclease RuvC